MYLLLAYIILSVSTNCQRCDKYSYKMLMNCLPGVILICSLSIVIAPFYWYTELHILLTASEGSNTYDGRNQRHRRHHCETKYLAADTDHQPDRQREYS